MNRQNTHGMLHVALCVGLGLHMPLLASPIEKSAKHQLEQLQQDIQVLRHHQAKDTTQKTALLYELKTIEQRISSTHIGIEKTKNSIQQLQTDLKQLEIEQAPLQSKYDHISEQLSHSLMASLQLSKADPLFLIANQKDPALTKRLLTYFSYIKQQQLTLLKDLQTLQQFIQEKKSAMQEKAIILTQLQSAQSKYLSQLQEDKTLQNDIIAEMSKQQKQRLAQLARLKNNESQLKRILNNIEQKQLQQTDHEAFATLKKRLPWPVKFTHKGQKPILAQLVKGSGVFIPMPEGQQIYAVRNGRVVFSDWLRGYGLLIIVQHDHGFMTLYANNQALYKEKGETVATGEKIATSGHSGGQLNDGLYFELRKDGSPLSPAQWLN